LSYKRGPHDPPVLSETPKLVALESGKRLERREAVENLERSLSNGLNVSGI